MNSLVLVTMVLGSTIYDQGALTEQKPEFKPRIWTTMAAWRPGQHGVHANINVHSERGTISGFTTLDRDTLHHSGYNATVPIEGAAEVFEPFEVYNPETIGNQEFTMGYTISRQDIDWSWKNEFTETLTPANGNLELWSRSGGEPIEWSGDSIVVDWWIQGPETRLEGTDEIQFEGSYFGYVRAYDPNHPLVYNGSNFPRTTVFNGDLDGSTFSVTIGGGSQWYLVPEPSTAVLGLIGLVLLPTLRQRKPSTTVDRRRGSFVQQRLR